MFCGACMHDNTLARALLDLGVEVSLIPTYTPIRVDERNVSSQRVLLGGINMYLDALLPGWNRIPRPLVNWLDSPGILKLASQFGISSDAEKLGKLAVALLQGAAGPEHHEVAEFARVLGRELQPDVICYSNALLVGTLQPLKQQFAGKVFCLLQGDDVFLEDLVDPYREQALHLIRTQALQFDGFLVHSQYYRDFMSEYLQLPIDKFHVVPLGIDLDGYDGQPRESAGQPFTVGYFARICPEKGLQVLVEALRILRRQRQDIVLKTAGYLGTRDQPFFETLQRIAADLGDAFQYCGSPPDHAGKVAFLKSLDLLSVPTVYREPKGLYVLEAMANGVPVVQPRHGAFPEMIAVTDGGRLVNPEDPADLARVIGELADDHDQRRELAGNAHAAVRRVYGMRTMAEATLAALTR